MKPHSLPEYVVGAWPDYAALMNTIGCLRLAWQRVEDLQQQILSSFPARLPGRCVACGRADGFAVDYPMINDGGHLGEPNWRETLPCACGLFNRIRAAIHVFRDFSQPVGDDVVYATEQVTPLFDYLKRHWPRAIGSEYLDPGATSGETITRGGIRVRHEDVTALSFEGASLDHLLSFDVLEHVPNHARALKEFSRCLRPGGTLLLSAPFDMMRHDTEVRARLRPDGSVEHLLPPEYHGDPVQPDKGVLCFQTFGWQLLEELCAHGFEDVRLLMLWSQELGYLGWGNVFVHARRSDRAS